MPDMSDVAASFSNEGELGPYSQLDVFVIGHTGNLSFLMSGEHQDIIFSRADVVRLRDLLNEYLQGI